MSNADTNRAVPFLAAFNAIERFLRDALGDEKVGLVFMAGPVGGEAREC